MVLKRRTPSLPSDVVPTSKGLVFIGVGFGLCTISSDYLHGGTVAAVLGYIAFVLVAVVIYSISNYFTAQSVVSGTFWALLLILIASLTLYIVQPAVAVENARLRGVVENANGLGFAAFCFGALTLAVKIPTTLRVLAVMATLSTLLLSGSRASAVALAIFIFASSILGSKRSQKALMLVLPATLILWLSFPSQFTNATLFRTIDTRSGGYETMRMAMTESPWIGVGSQASENFVAGSIFAIGIWGGLLGILGLLTMYLGVLRMGLDSKPMGFAFVLAGLFHSLFESWMLSFSSPMLLIFFMVAICCIHSDHASAHLHPQDATIRRPRRQSEVHRRRRLTA